MRCVANVHYEVLREWDLAQRTHWWLRETREPAGDIKALRCRFCDYQVLKRNTARPQSSTSGLGRYNRMRGLMVAHLHREHRASLEKTQEG